MSNDKSKQNKAYLIVLIITCLTLVIGFVINIENLKHFGFISLVIGNSIIFLMPIIEFIMKLPMSLAMTGFVSPEVENLTKRRLMLAYNLIFYVFLNHTIFNKILW